MNLCKKLSSLYITPMYFKNKTCNRIPNAFQWNLSTPRTVTSLAIKETPPVLSTSEKNYFFAEFPNIISTICERNKIAAVPELDDWMNKLFHYCSSGGHKSRGLMVPTAYKIMETSENYNEENMKNAIVLGWCVELLQTGLLIIDDMIDNSSTRRGLVCWHRLPGVGYNAINDASFFLSAIFDYLKGKFGDKPYYFQILDKFHESIADLAISTKLETLTQRQYNHFTMQRYNLVSSVKMSYYTFGLLLELSAMLLANKGQKNVLDDAANIIRDMGILIMTQNDYTDCYEDESVTGKVGNDIQEGKCTWLAVEALRRCSDEQRSDFEKYYGSNDPSHAQQIKDIYQSLGIQDLCREHIRTFYEDIVQRINDLPDRLPHSSKAIRGVLDIMYYFPSVKNSLK